MSLLGDIVRTSSAPTRPLVVVERGQEWKAVHTNTNGRPFDQDLQSVLINPCSFLTDHGMKALKEYERSAKAAFAVRQQRAHGGAWKR